MTVELEEGELVETDEQDELLDIPMPVFSDIVAGPVCVQSGVDLRKHLANDRDKENMSESKNVLSQKGEASEQEDTVGIENKLNTMNVLIQEVQGLEKQKNQDMENGGSSDICVSSPQADGNSVIMPATEISTHLPIDDYLQKNSNLNVWNETSTVTGETDKELEDLNPLVSKVAKLIKIRVTDGGNSPEWTDNLQKRLAEVLKIMPRLNSGELKSEWVKDITKMMRINIRDLQKQYVTATRLDDNANVSLYVNIEPPLGDKPRPPDIIIDQVHTNSGEKAQPKTPITRNMKKEMMRNLQENG